MKAGALLPLVALVGLGCGGGESPRSEPTDSGRPTTGASDELTAIELEQGLGPIRNLELAEIDPALATEGEAAFQLKCSACHKVEERYIGPELGTVLGRRSPEFVMNMMLNANEMVARHPVVRELLAEYYTPMPMQDMNEAEARSILEYLRSVQH